jgi:hypothetical protein
VSAHVLAKVARYPDVTTTDQGIILAMWTATEDRTRLEWAVKRPGKPWTEPKVKGDWAVSPSTHGMPQLTTSSHHRVTATWLDARRRVVVEDWSPTRGWSKPLHLSNKRHTAWNPVIVSNAAGKVAIAWTSQDVGFSNPLFAKVAVRRGGSWSVTRVGPKKVHGFPGYPVELGIAADGAVTAAWENVRGDLHPEFLARRLPAGTTTWEPTHDFGNLFQEDINADPIGLAVQPDGSEMLSRPTDSGGHDVFTRVGQGEWTDQGDQPFVYHSLSLPSGGLVAWSNAGVFEDSDGIAGPASFVSIGYPEPPLRDVQFFATSSSGLVAVAHDGHHVVFSTRPSGGTWSDPQVAYTDRHRWIAQMSAIDMTPDGRVTALLSTRPAGSGRHHPWDLEAICFDATV